LEGDRGPHRADHGETGDSGPHPEFGVFAIAAVAEGLAKFSPKPALVNFEKARDMVQEYWTCDHHKALRTWVLSRK